MEIPGSHMSRTEAKPCEAKRTQCVGHAAALLTGLVRQLVHPVHQAAPQLLQLLAQLPPPLRKQHVAPPKVGAVAHAHQLCGKGGRRTLVKGVPAQLGKATFGGGVGRMRAARAYQL